MLRVINAIENSIKLPLIPIESNEIQEQVIYEYNLTAHDGVIATYNLRLNIACYTLADAEATHKTIVSNLLSIGDIKKNDIQDIVVSGGGILKSEVFTHYIVYYTIKIKELIK